MNLTFVICHFKKILEWVKYTLFNTEKINYINYLVEYLWTTILNFNDKLIISKNNC